MSLYSQPFPPNVQAGIPQLTFNESGNFHSDMLAAPSVGENNGLVQVRRKTEQVLTMHRSLRFWLEDGSVVLSVGQTLYKVYRGLFANLSPIWKDLFEVPPQMSKSGEVEGLSETLPISLWDVDTDDFEALLEWMIGPVFADGEQPSVFSPTVRQLIGILNLATKWDMLQPKHEATVALDALPLTGEAASPDWSPVAKFACCVRFRIGPWLIPTLRALRQLEPRQWIGQHYAYFGNCPLSARWLYNFRERIEWHRKALHWEAPEYVKGVICNQASQCQNNWTATWHQVLSSKLLHPDQPLTDHELFELIRDKPHPTGLCLSCHRAVVAKMELNPDWNKEEEIIIKVAGLIRVDCAIPDE